MRNANLFASIAIILLVTACGSVQPPDAGIESLAAKVTVSLEQPGFAFLPPIGDSLHAGPLFVHARLSVDVLALDGNRAGSVLHSVPVHVTGGSYQGLWRVAASMRASSNVTHVEVRAYRDDLPERTLLGSFRAMIRTTRTMRTAAAGVMNVSRARTLPIRMHFEDAPSGVVPDTLGGLTPLKIDSFRADETFNCIINEFTMPTQGFNSVGAGFNSVGAGFNSVGAGFNAKGSVGGLFLFEQDPTSAGTPVVRLFDPQLAYDLARSLASTGSGGGEYEEYYAPDVAILIVDDFNTASGLDYKVPDELLTPADSQDDLTYVAVSSLSHGALVMHQVVQMLVNDPAWALAETAFDWGPGFVVFVNDLGQHLVVGGVDTGGFETDVIPQRIQNALNALLEISEMEGSFYIDRVTINMSFAIVPCGVLDDYQAFVESLPQTFEEYVEALGDANGLRGLEEELARLVLTPLAGESEPLFDYIDGPGGCHGEGWSEDEGSYTWEGLVTAPPYYVACWSTGGESGRYVNYYASSGNFGLDYPMFPAAWPLVVSVGAQNAVSSDPSDPDSDPSFEPPTKSFFSNRAEVMAPGALFELGRSGDQALGYAGTSYSSPVVALFGALDLLNDWPRCADPTTSTLADAVHPDQTANADHPFDATLVGSRCYSYSD